MPFQERKNDFDVQLIAPCHNFLLHPHGESKPIPQSILQLVSSPPETEESFTTSNGMVLLVQELGGVLPRSLSTRLGQLHRENAVLFQEPKLHLQSVIRVLAPPTFVKIEGVEVDTSTVAASAGGAPVLLQVRDTRVSAALYESIVRHGFITLASGTIRLEKETQDLQALPKFLAPRARMQMDDDVLKPTIAWIEARKAALMSATANGSGATGEEADAQKAELEALLVGSKGSSGISSTKGLKLLLNGFIIPQVKALSIYNDEGEATPFAACLWLLHQLDLYASDLSGLLKHANRYVRGVAMFYARYVVAPEELPKYWLDVNVPAAVIEASDDTDGAGANNLVNHDGRRGPLFDRTEVALADDEDGTIHQVAMDLMSTDEVLEAWFPTYPAFALETIKSQVAQRQQLIQNQARILKNAKTTTGDGDGSEADAATSGMDIQKKKAKPSTAFFGFKSLKEMVSATELAFHMAKNGARFEQQVGHSSEGISTRTETGDEERKRQAQSRKRARDRQDALERGEFTVVADSVYLEF